MLQQKYYFIAYIKLSEINMWFTLENNVSRVNYKLQQHTIIILWVPINVSLKFELQLLIKKNDAYGFSIFLKSL